MYQIFSDQENTSMTFPSLTHCLKPPKIFNWQNILQEICKLQSCILTNFFFV